MEFIFNEEFKDFSNDQEINIFFLKHIEAWANDNLKLRGYIFLNDIYRELGLELTQSGQVTGWTYAKCKKIDFKINRIENTNYVKFELKTIGNILSCLPM